MLILVTAGVIGTFILRRQFHWRVDVIPTATFGRINSKRNAARPIGCSAAVQFQAEWPLSSALPEADVGDFCSITSNSSCHLSAFFGAMLTCLCAVLTMLRLMFCAFIAAGLTNFGADAADPRRKLRTARHQACCSRAYRGACTIQLDATRHHFHILLVQAFGRAMFAGNHAVVTCVDTALIFFVCHNLPSVVCFVTSSVTTRGFKVTIARTEAGGWEQPHVRPMRSLLRPTKRDGSYDY